MLNTACNYSGLAKQRRTFFLTTAAYPSPDTKKVPRSSDQYILIYPKLL